MMTGEFGEPILESRLNVKNFALAGGLLAGATLFFTTIISLSTGYGSAFLEIVMSVYPGFRISFFGAIIGFIYAFLDASIALFVLAWVYNYLETKRQRKLLRGKVHVAK